jgi:hypothetical protein
MARCGLFLSDRGSVCSSDDVIDYPYHKKEEQQISTGENA